MEDWIEDCLISRLGKLTLTCTDCLGASLAVPRTGAGPRDAQFSAEKTLRQDFHMTLFYSFGLRIHRGK